MFLSTNEYLELMRKGDFLAALKWVGLVANHYQGNSEKGFDADTLLLLAVYELIHSDFSSKDLAQIVILYSLLNDKPRLFKGDLDYAATVLFNAAIQFLVYDQFNLLSFYTNPDLQNSEDVINWMNRENTVISAMQNSDANWKKYQEINELVPQYRYQVDENRNTIIPLFDCQELCKSYMDELSINKDKSDIAAIRFGIVSALYDFLIAQTRVDAQFLETRASYINTLKRLEHDDWEDSVLSRLSPESFTRRVYNGTRFAFLFFAEKIWHELLPQTARLDSNTIDSSIKKN